jgi:glyoxylase-like metal-dependent hydrolase (beta-lactamase superfamily II)
MNRLHPFSLAIGLLTLLGAASCLAEQQATAVKTEPLRGPLHLLQGRGGNVVASIGIDGILLVDDDYAEYAPAYARTLAELAQSDTAPGFVLNTHWHDDHSGGNEYWALGGAVILAHTNVRARMSTRQEMAALNRVVEPSPAVALPVVTYGDSLTLHFNGSDVEVQHYPSGHTDGDSVVFYSEENAVHMGDLFFKDRFPFIDLGSGGSVSGYTANVAAVLARIDDETLVVPGHGGLADKADLQRYHDMLVATAGIVRAAAAKGLDEQAIIARGLGDQWGSWGKGFISEEAWIRTLAASP